MSISADARNDVQISPKTTYEPRTLKQKRMGCLTGAVLSGLTWNKGKRVRFMTLTSGDGATDHAYHFKLLVDRIRHQTPMKLAQWESDRQLSGLLKLASKSDILTRYYRDKPVDEPLNLEYCATRTDEGNGVIHALLVGDAVPQNWLSISWNDLHGAWNVDIRGEKRGGKKTASNFSRYMFQQYVKGQNGILRSWTSQNWIYPGWRDDMKTLIHDNGYQTGIVMWDLLMRDHRRLSEVGQQTLKNWYDGLPKVPLLAPYKPMKFIREKARDRHNLVLPGR